MFSVLSEETEVWPCLLGAWFFFFSPNPDRLAEEHEVNV
uniref:Uncharacterized protein n=1 Tax=Anguilla anguilla TaxID=7936 RepID=A0A0E9Q4L5_ANGAN